MKRVHFLSGVIITSFIILHLFNHLYSLLGIEAHIGLMDQLRTIYRNIFVETVLVSVVFLQIISGLKLFLNKRANTTTFFEKLQLWSGLYMAFFFIFHLGAVFTGRFILNLDTNIFFGVAGLNTFPFNLFFIPYYGLAIISFFGHLASIHSFKMNRSLFKIPPNTQAKTILIVGVLFSILIIYGLTNKFNGVTIPKEYHIMIGK